jgi:DNA-binding NtrC family response regulator
LPNEGKRVGILAAPLATKSGVFGLVYLDVALAQGETRPGFRTSDLRFAAALATFAATRIGQLRRIAPIGLVGARPLPDLRAAFEKERIVEALRQKKGDIDGAAKVLGLTKATLDEKLKIMGLVATPPAPPPAPPPAADWKSVQT